MSGVKVWSTIEDHSGKIEILNYQEKYQNGVIDVIRKSFYQYEAVSVGSEINNCIEAQQDLDLLCLDVLEKSNCSLIARDVESDEIVGVALNVVQLKPTASTEPSYFENFRDNVCTTENAKSLMTYMITMDSKFDCFEHYKIKSLLEIMFLATLPEHGQRGVGSQLCLCSIELAKSLKNSNNLEGFPVEVKNNPPQLVSALFTSEYSQKIGKKLGFTTLLVEPHKNFLFREKSFAERNGDPECVSCLVAKNI